MVDRSEEMLSVPTGERDELALMRALCLVIDAFSTGPLAQVRQRGISRAVDWLYAVYGTAAVEKRRSEQEAGQ